MRTTKTGRGITKVELIIILAVIVAVAAGIAVYTTVTLGSINDDIDRSTLKTFQLSVDLFFFYNGRYPGADEIVQAVREHSGYAADEPLPCPRKKGYHYYYDFMEARLYMAEEGNPGLVICG